MTYPDDPQHPAGGYAPSGPDGRTGRGTNGAAVAALVTGILGVLCVTALAAVVLGVVALRQIRRTGQRGRGAAVAGIALAVLWLVGLGVGAALTVPTLLADDEPTAAPSTTASSPPAPTGTPGTTAPTAAPAPEPAVLQVGDCVDDPTIVDGVDVLETAVVDCARPHHAETFARFDLPDGDYPGEEAVTAAAEAGCDTAFADFVGLPFQESVLDVVYFYPTEPVWGSDRAVVCIVVDPSREPVTGSVQGSRR